MSTSQMISEAGGLSADELHELIGQLTVLKEHRLRDETSTGGNAAALFRQLQQSVALTPERAHQWKLAVADGRE